MSMSCSSVLMFSCSLFRYSRHLVVMLQYISSWSDMSESSPISMLERYLRQLLEAEPVVIQVGVAPPPSPPCETGSFNTLSDIYQCGRLIQIFLIAIDSKWSGYLLYIFIKSISPMSTPLNLKRKHPTMLSTLDRTAHTQHTLSSAVPSFAQASVPLIPRARPLPNHQVPLQSFQSTTELEEKLHRFLESDNEASEVVRQKEMRNKSYIDYHGRFKFVKGPTCSFPKEVTEVHSEQEHSLNHAPGFEHGCLPESALYYFAIENQVLFYDFGRAARTAVPLQNCFLHRFQFPDRVFELRELKWTSPFLGQLRQKNVVVVSSPWQLQFIVLEKTAPQLERHSSSAQIVRITFLNHYLPLNSPRAFNLVEGHKQFFYVDDCARVAKASFEPNSILGKLFYGGRHKASLATASNKWSKNYFHLSRKASLLQSIRHYGKVVLSGFKSFFTKRHHVHALIFDKKRSLLFSLIEAYHNQAAANSSEYSFSKMLVCWQIDGRIQKKAQISQVQLLSQNQAENLFTKNIGKNNKMATIEILDPSYHPYSCILAILENGIRLYLSLKADKFVVEACEYPPSFELNNKNERSCQEYIRPVQLVHFRLEGSGSLMTIRRDSQSHTFFIWKDSQLRQKEFCAELKWGQIMTEGVRGQPPLQSHLRPSSLGLINSSKTTFLNCFGSEPSKKNFLSDPINASFLNPLAGGLYQEPSLFIHATDIYLEYFFLSRPIDMLFMAISAGVKQSQQLKSIFPGLQARQIQCLLLQLLCDQEGVYLSDPCTVECLNTYSRTGVETGKIKPFEIHKNEFFREYLATNSQYNSLKEQKASIVDHFQPSEQQYSTICHLILSSCRNEENQQQKYQQQINSVIDCVLAYLSRILRFVWTRDLADIPSKTVCLVNFIDPLLKAINTIFNEQYLLKVKSEVSSQARSLQQFRARFYDSSKEGKKNTTAEQFQKSIEMIDKLKFFISKTIQLILLTTSSQIKVKKKFYACLAMDPSFFEEHLFHSLLMNSTHALSTLNSFKKLFPLFIGPDLEKALKIENQTAKASPKDALRIVREHRSLPQYLFDYLKQKKKISKDEVFEAGIKKKEMLRMKDLAGSKESIQQLQNRLNQQYLDLSEREHIMVVMRGQLQIYFGKTGVRDHFYCSTQRSISELSKIIALQHLLLQYYQQVPRANQQIIDSLSFSLLKVDSLSRIIDVVQINPIKIVFYYYFTQQFERDQRISPMKLFETMFSDAYEDFYGQMKGFGSMLFQLSSRVNKTWKILQKSMNIIWGHVKEEVNLRVLVSQLGQTLENARMNYQQKSDTIIETFSSLSKYISQEYPKKKLHEWVLTNNFPLVGLMLVESGLDFRQLKTVYLQLLHQLVYDGVKISNSKLSYLYSCWLNLFGLLIQQQGQTPEFIIKTKAMLKKLKKDALIQPSQLQKIKNLTQNLIELHFPDKQMVIDWS